MKIYRYGEKCNICGQKIRALRKERGITQEQLGARMQVRGIILDQRAISRIESGKRVVADYELRALARVFGVKMEELLEDVADT